MDKPGAEPDRVRRELLQHGLVAEEMGGEVITVPVSAKTRAGLDKLEELILLQAEVLELRANANRRADGIVVEAKLDRGRGAVATVLIQRGTLRVGDIIVAGREWGRVRALVNDRGQQVDAVLPGEPTEVLGLTGTPEAGDEFSVVEDETRARDITAFRAAQARSAIAATTGRSSLEQMFDKIKVGEAKTLPIIVKGDVRGSVEAIQQALEGISNEEVSVRVIHNAVGAITESDVTLAQASRALIIGFNVRANAQARERAKRDNVDIRYYSIIYNLVDDMKASLSGMLKPALRENTLGQARIKEVFSITKVGKIAGCEVVEGVARRGARLRLLRDDVVIHEGAIDTLKHFKDDVREVRAGSECGIAIENFQDVQVGDMIEIFEVQEIARTL
jgi:translation initiation factor IF-2